ncbi:Cyclin-U4-1 [Coccomyxa sp. Obi]|nr:Cyclin-U4-1 [Coccomyxa sp. Obi]
MLAVEVLGYDVFSAPLAGAPQKAAPELHTSGFHAAPVAPKTDTSSDCEIEDRDELFFPELVGESSEEEGCELLTTLSAVFERVILTAEESMSSSQSQRLSPFDGLRVPNISLQNYIWRISRYSKCSNVCFCMAFTYLQRLNQVDTAYRLTRRNAHRLVLTSVLLAAKLMDDNLYNNAYWAKIGGVSAAELNMLEVLMLKQLGYSLFVGEEQVAHCLRQLKVLARTPLHSGPLHRSKKRVMVEAAAQ